MLLRRRIHITPQGSALHRRQPCRGINRDTTHERKVDHHTTVADRMTRDIVSATTNSNGQVTGNRELNCCLHVARSSALSDQRRTAIYHRIPNTPRAVKSHILRANHFATVFK
jgi:hypothetical protein